MPTETFFNLPEYKRERFIDAALDEFAECAYSRASVSRIARRAGVAKGSVYQYFRDKKDLYLYLIDLASKVKMDFIMSRQSAVDWTRFYEGLEALLLLGTEFEFSGARQAKLARLVRNAMESEVWDEGLARVKQTSQSAVEDLLREARDRGQVRDDVPLDFALFCMNTLMTTLGEYVASKAGVSLSELADVLERGEGAVDRADGTGAVPGVKVLGLDFTAIVEDLVKVIRNGLEPPERRGDAGMGRSRT